ncbi:hypothetical protein EI94DRAFT_751033 [Lactarius quietus]|nr:hypothetical protein EI94DRAFT_751033 [Lactarius quietus]
MRGIWRPGKCGGTTSHDCLLSTKRHGHPHPRCCHPQRHPCLWTATHPGHIPHPPPQHSRLSTPITPASDSHKNADGTAYTWHPAAHGSQQRHTACACASNTPPPPRIPPVDTLLDYWDGEELSSDPENGLLELHVAANKLASFGAAPLATGTITTTATPVPTTATATTTSGGGFVPFGEAWTCRGGRG